MKQFELWWARLPEPVGRRRVLLLSRSPGCIELKRALGYALDFAELKPAGEG